MIGLLIGLLIYYGCFMATLVAELVTLRVMHTRSGLTRDDFLYKTFIYKDDWFVCILLLAAAWPGVWAYAIYRVAKAGLYRLVFREHNGEVE